jgi:hypothetical protein
VNQCSFHFYSLYFGSSVIAPGGMVNEGIWTPPFFNIQVLEDLDHNSPVGSDSNPVSWRGRTCSVANKNVKDL